MSSLEVKLTLALGAVFLLWLGVSLYIVLTRLLFDVRERFVRAAHRVVERQIDDAVAAEAQDVVVARIARRLPRRSVERIAADTLTPRELAVAFSRELVARHGRRLERAARAETTSEVAKWKRVAALRILAQAQAPNALDCLAHALRETDPDVVGGAVAILGEMPDEGAARLLVDALREETFPRSRVASQLDDFPIDTAHLVLPLLSDHEPMVRYWAAKLLARYPDLPGLDVELVALVGDPEPMVRAAAVETLRRVGGDAAASAALLLLDDPVPFVRAHAARALSGAEQPEIASFIAALLSDEHWWVRLAAKESLESMPPHAIGELVRYLDHEDRFARNGAAEVLQNIGFVDRLVEDLRDAPRDETAHETLRRVLSAGERRFAEMTLARASEADRPLLRGLLPEPAARAPS